MKKKNWFDLAYQKLLSQESKKKIERVILSIAIISFIIHLIIIYLVQSGLISIKSDIKLFSNPIAAIYTPFSFILIYEVYLLIFYLPQSITTYVGKQYEIISLIIIRRLFKDLSNLEMSQNWFSLSGDKQFTYDIIASIILFYLIYLFRSSYKRMENKSLAIEKDNIHSFIRLKEKIACVLVPVLFVLGTYSLIHWLAGIGNNAESIPFKNINNIFFDQFFTVLITVDVVMLLASFFYTDSFHKVIRNSGFVISTILIRLSFSVEGIVNIILILMSVIFGLLILTIHNKYEKAELPSIKETGPATLS
jgi:hypothetical protein